MGLIYVYIVSALVSASAGLFLGASFNSPVGGMILLTLINSTCFILYAISKKGKNEEQDKLS